MIRIPEDASDGIAIAFIPAEGSKVSRFWIVAWSAGVPVSKV